jgi:hypothetical protein
MMVLAALLAATLGMTAAPGGAEIPCSTNPTVNPASGLAGTAVTISDGPNPCVSSEYYYGVIDALVATSPAPQPGEEIASVRVANDGSYSIPYTIPAGAAPGPIDFYVTIWFTPYEGGASPAEFSGEAVVTGQPLIGSPLAEGGPATFTVTAPAPSVDPAISVSKKDLLPGEEFEVTAKGFEPGSEVELFLESDPVLLARVTADSAGALVATVRVPADFPAGPHTVAAVGTGIGGAALRLEAGVTVGALVGAAAAPATPTPARTNALPYTG